MQWSVILTLIWLHDFTNRRSILIVFTSLESANQSNFIIDAIIQQLYWEGKNYLKLQNDVT